VENMKTENSNIQQQTRKSGLSFLGEIPYDVLVEEAIGNTNRLMNTVLAKKVEEIATKI